MHWKNKTKYTEIGRRVLYWAPISFIFFFSPLTLASQTKMHAKWWASSYLTGKFKDHEKWRYAIQPELRFIDDKYKFNQALLTASIGYQTTEYVTLWLGANRTYTEESEGNSRQEYRLWQLVSWDVLPTTTYILSNRARLEERKLFSSSALAIRARDMLVASIPAFASERYRLIISDEVFLNLNRPGWVTDKFFAENRAAIGVRTALTQQTALEIGYLNQYQFSTPNQMSNVIYSELNVDFG